jgi:hypothetical protein
MLPDPGPHEIDCGSETLLLVMGYVVFAFVHTHLPVFDALIMYFDSSHMYLIIGVVSTHVFA